MNNCTARPDTSPSAVAIASTCPKRKCPDEKCRETGCSDWARSVASQIRRTGPAKVEACIPQRPTGPHLPTQMASRAGILIPVALWRCGLSVGGCPLRPARMLPGPLRRRSAVGPVQDSRSRDIDHPCSGGKQDAPVLKLPGHRGQDPVDVLQGPDTGRRTRHAQLRYSPTREACGHHYRHCRTPRRPSHPRRRRLSTTPVLLARPPVQSRSVQNDFLRYGVPDVGPSGQARRRTLDHLACPFGPRYRCAPMHAKWLRARLTRQYGAQLSLFEMRSFVLGAGQVDFIQVDPTESVWHHMKPLDIYRSVVDASFESAPVHSIEPCEHTRTIRPLARATSTCIGDVFVRPPRRSRPVLPHSVRLTEVSRSPPEDSRWSATRWHPPTSTLGSSPSSRNPG